MSRIDKLKEKLYGTPMPTDMTIKEVERLARAYGCEVQTGGNHQIAIVYQRLGVVIPIPQHGKTIPKMCIGELIKLFNDIDDLT